MKFSAALAALAAPLALAKAVHNVYPAKRDADLFPRKSEDKQSEKSQGGEGQAQAGQALASMSGPGQQISASQAQLITLGLSGAGITANAATEVIIIWVNQGAGAPTMNVNPPPMAAPATAQTHEVVVGGAAGLQFTPSEIKAAVGDMVVFTFMSANHTATQSAFATPCEALAGGMDSGFQPNANNSVNPPPQVAMQVMVDTPLWFYCKQKGHCGKGMTFSINPTAAKTQAMFQSMAIAQNGTGAATPITGGSAPPANSAAPPNATGGGAAAAPAEGGSAGAAAGGSATTPTMGQGTIQNGACVCAVSCSVGSFPAAQAQGLGAFGGLPGALPANMTEVTMNG
ncbi:serine-threonine rich protein [Diaporthe amygdali]|uniref:serine-threonine rich protein n=1 Tax=Phomopsis amygdali TaxID=1214568 RepID=UPI0022FDDD12|nr:serine-threonine rich protein [Diaporthe amygdali]KAJ0124897.1 serine-threonine rich protein [Diaporthe amygdali]